MNEKKRLAGCLFVSAALGLASVILPVFILSLKRYDAPLFPLVRSGIEGMAKLTLVFLFVSGVFLGILCPKRPFLVGMCTMAAFPLLTFADGFVDPTSHNLLPFEFLMYAAVGLIAVVGAYIGHFIYRLTHKQDPPVAAPQR